MPVPWALAEPRIGGDPAQVIFVDSMERDVVDQQLADAPDFDCVVAIGGGQAIDLGKYFSWKRGCRLITIPTVISVDAFVTSAAAVRVDRKVEYVGESSPDPLVIDYDLIRTAPADLNIAGVGDLLSIHTAIHDWQRTQRAGRSEYPFHMSMIEDAQKILDDMEASADDIRALSDQGLRSIVEGYMAMNRICVPAGHYRIEEGSEHFLFYELERITGEAYIHGHIIGLGIYLMSHLQGNDPEGITQVMDRCGLKYQPRDMGIERETLREALLGVKRFVQSRPDIWYSVIDEEEITPEWADRMLDTLEF
jgi:glycerol dehydrogenase-like iron-containing ADH family enzyme